MADGILTSCNLACDFGIVTVNSPSGTTLHVIRGSGMTCNWIRPTVRHTWLLHLVSISTYHHSRHVILNQSAKFYPNQTTLGRKNDVMSILKMAELSHIGLLGSNNGFFEKPSSAYITSYRSSINTIALNCLVFEKITFFAFWRQTDRQTNRRTNRWTSLMREAAARDLNNAIIRDVTHLWYLKTISSKLTG